MNFKFFGSGCEVTAFIQEPGKIRERRWETYPWCLPDTEIHGCWWLTNPRDDADSVPKLVWKSLVSLRIELRQTHVATPSKIYEERTRRKETNENIRKLLSENPQWRVSAGRRQLGHVLHPDNAQVDDLLLWWAVTSNAAVDQAEEQFLSAEERAFAFDEIKRLLQALVTEDDEEVRCMRFSSTPYELYKEMLSAVLCRDSQETGAQKWQCHRLNVAMAQVDPDEDDANLPEADAPDAVNRDGYVPRDER